MPQSFQIDVSIYEEFEEITTYPLQSYFEAFVSFMEDDFPLISEYYRGSGNNPVSSFERLNILISETNKLFEIINTHSNILNNFQWWLVVEKVEQVDSALNIVNTFSKWLRSSITNTSFTPNVEYNVVMKQNQTLEDISRRVLGDSDWFDNWVRVGINNQLEEEKYTTGGGNNLKVYFTNSAFTIDIISIVDSIQGDKILGVDLDKKLSFVSNDLKILVPRDTFIQTVQILISLKKGDNKEFPQEGLDPNITVGTNVNLVSFPLIIRQLHELFATDDTIKSFSVVDIKRTQDGVFLQFEVQSRRDEVEQAFIKLT